MFSFSTSFCINFFYIPLFFLNHVTIFNIFFHLSVPHICQTYLDFEQYDIVTCSTVLAVSLSAYFSIIYILFRLMYIDASGKIGTDVLQFLTDMRRLLI